MTELPRSATTYVFLSVYFVAIAASYKKDIKCPCSHEAHIVMTYIFLTWPTRGKNPSHQLQWVIFREGPQLLILGYMSCPPLNQSLWLWARYFDQPSLGHMPSAEVYMIRLLLARRNRICINKIKRYLWPSATEKLNIARGNSKTFCTLQIHGIQSQVFSIPFTDSLWSFSPSWCWFCPCIHWQSVEMLCWSWGNKDK